VGLSRSLAAGALLAIAPLALCADEPPESGPPTSIWDGIYTEAQAGRGGFIYPSICGRCHGVKLDGAPDDPDFLPAPPIAGPKFLRKWSGVSLGALFEYVRTSMPAMNPGSISADEFADVLAYMLRAGGAPAGATELKPDIAAIGAIVIAPAPGRLW
jgi:mono/diheme cytochrome c family protein